MQAAAEQYMPSNGLVNGRHRSMQHLSAKLCMLARQDGQWRCRHATHCTLYLQSSCTREYSSDGDRAALAHSSGLRKVAWILECASKWDLQRQALPDLKAEMTEHCVMPTMDTAAAYYGAGC